MSEERDDRSSKEPEMSAKIMELVSKMSPERQARLVALLSDEKGGAITDFLLSNSHDRLISVLGPPIDEFRERDERTLDVNQKLEADERQKQLDKFWQNEDLKDPENRYFLEKVAEAMKQLGMWVSALNDALWEYSGGRDPVQFINEIFDKENHQFPEGPRKELKDSFNDLQIFLNTTLPFFDHAFKRLKSGSADLPKQAELSSKAIMALERHALNLDKKKDGRSFKRRMTDTFLPFIGDSRDDLFGSLHKYARAMQFFIEALPLEHPSHLPGGKTAYRKVISDKFAKRRLGGTNTELDSYHEAIAGVADALGFVYKPVHLYRDEYGAEDKGYIQKDIVRRVYLAKIVGNNARPPRENSVVRVPRIIAFDKDKYEKSALEDYGRGLINDSGAVIHLATRTDEY